MTNEFIIENGVKILKTNQVFYNPAQKFNRDLTISIVNEFIKEIKNPKIFEAMSATGLRGIRFYNEINKKCEIHLNDYDADAINNIKSNLLLNNIDITNTNETKSIYIHHNNCNITLYQHRNFFDVIDIDPFGCCTPFIDSALANIKHGGLLCLTSTDTGVLCSNKKKCYIKYNAIIAKTPAHKEQSIRVLLGYVAKSAGKYNKSITPIVSIFVDFYVRIFVKVFNNNKQKTYEDVSYYLYCTCFYNVEIVLKRNKTIKCERCGNDKMTLVGPLYNKSIKDNIFIEELKKTSTDRIYAMMSLLRNEIDTFLFYSIPAISKYLKKCCIPIKYLLNALFNKNYEVSFTHCEINCIKTNASISIIEEIINKYFEKTNDQVFSFNNKIKELLKRDFKLDILSSGLGPLSLPQKK